MLCGFALCCPLWCAVNRRWLLAILNVAIVRLSVHRRVVVFGVVVADLIVGCPYARGSPSVGTSGIQQGAVLAFFSSPKWTSGLTLLDTAADAAYYGDSQFAWFGYSVEVASGWNGKVTADCDRVGPCIDSFLPRTDV